MTRPALTTAALAAAVLLAGQTAATQPAASAAGAADCGAALDPRHRKLLGGKHHQLAFAPTPAPIATGRHFGLDLVVCPKPGASMPIALRLDADMPAHRHGMNYLPTLRPTGEGRYRADGYLLHMPGRWRFIFDLSADGRIERLTHEVDLP